MNKYPVGVLGASGYAGRELCMLIARHPSLTLGFAAANERAGECITVGDRAMTLVSAEDAPLGEVALVFSALPHGASAEYVARAQAAGAKVVDLSADHRPTKPNDVVCCPTPYGLPELGGPIRTAIRDANVVANPGCYATAVLLGLAPLLLNDVVARGATVSVAAASGVSGAGNSPRRDLLFGEVAENYRAYAVGNTHRHLAEMRAVIGWFHSRCDLVFTPHLLPVSRGILATITVPTQRDQDVAKMVAAYYSREPFIEVVSNAPSLRDVAHRNVARIAVTVVEGVEQPTVVVFVAIDNLLKGAAGQAMQNANLMLGLDETAGLPR